MKEKIIKAAAGAMVIVLIVVVLALSFMGTQSAKAQATAPNVIYTKPALPKVVRHRVFGDMDQTNEYVGRCIRDGYIIKCIAISGYNAEYYVVAEKY